MVQTVSMASVAMGLLALEVIANAPQPYPPIDVATGSDSYTERPSIELASDPQNWYDAWQRYKGVTPIGNSSKPFPSLEKPPPVDFDHNFVLVVFGGLASSVGYQVQDSFTQKKVLHVRLREIPLSPSGVVPAGIKANPYAFIVYRRTKFPIEVEFPSTDRDGNTVWRSVAKLGGETANAGR